MAEERIPQFVAYLDEPEEALDPDEYHDAIELGDGVYLFRSDQTLSKLYHAIKHHARPKGLFVGKLDGEPKFKGMATGALKWVRRDR